MFPHVGGKSNLKKNRILLDGFLKSAKLKLKTNGCIYLALAKGQGGTKFEVDAKKSNDNWQLLNYTNKNGYLLTNAEIFDENCFIFYKSTGFRSGNRSFHVQNAIIHQLQLSLPLTSPSNKIDSEVDSAFSINRLNGFDFKNAELSFLHKYLIKAIQLSQFNKIDFVHPLVYLNNIFDDILKSNSLVLINQSNFVDCHLANYNTQTYKLDQTCLDIIYSKLNQNLNIRDYFFKNKLQIEDFIEKCKVNDQVYAFNALLPSSRSLNSNNELFNLKYESLYYLKSLNKSFIDAFRNSILKLVDDVKNKSFIKINHHSNGTYIYDTRSNYIFISVTLNSGPIEELVANIDFLHFCAILNDLDDKRLILSDDIRNFNKNYTIVPFLKETFVHRHDVSFWYNKEIFKFEDFLDVIRDVCGSLVRCVNFIDSYDNQNESNSLERYALTYSILYESCDYAFGWEESRKLQERLRESLRARLKFIIK